MQPVNGVASCRRSGESAHRRSACDVERCRSSTGELKKIDHLLIHFDVRKVPSLRHREATIHRQLAEAGVEYFAAEDIQFRAGAIRGTRNWLLWCHGDPRTRDVRYKTVSRIEFRGRRLLYPVETVVMRLFR